jgi:hypothetical protein
MLLSKSPSTLIWRRRKSVPFMDYLLSASYMLGTIIGNKDREVNKKLAVS